MSLRLGQPSLILFCAPPCFCNFDRVMLSKLKVLSAAGNGSSELDNGSIGDSDSGAGGAS